MSSTRTPSRILEITTAAMDEESRRLSRLTRGAMVVESVLVAALSVLGVLAVLDGAGETATVAGITLGLPHFLALGITAVTVLLALPGGIALRRAALVKAVGLAALFVAGAVYYPAGAWAVDMPGALLPAVVALAGMAEFILLGSANFASAPSSSPAEEPVSSPAHEH